MKHVAQVLSLGLIIVMVVIAVLTITGRNSSDKDAQEALSSTIQETLNNMSISGSYHLDTEDEFKADFIETFMDNINDDEVTVTDDDGTKSKLKVEDMNIQFNFAVADPEKEIIMVDVIETFTYPNGSTGVVEETASAIFSNESEMREYSVSYKIEQEEIEERKIASPVDFKAYNIEEGQTFDVPSNPKDENGNTIPIYTWVCTKAPDDGRQTMVKSVDGREYPITVGSTWSPAILSRLEINGDYEFTAQF